MVRFADRFRVESSRLVGWNYSSSGFYFVTICTLNHNNFFGKIENEKMVYTRKGFLAYRDLMNISVKFKNVKLINSVVMPNHVHILLEIVEENGRDNSGDDNSGRDAINRVSTTNNVSTINNIFTKKTKGLIEKNPMNNFSLGTVVRWYKAKTTREIRKEGLFFGWQSGYFDEVVQGEDRLKVIMYYIKNNLRNWEKDKLYRMKDVVGK